MLREVDSRTASIVTPTIQYKRDNSLRIPQQVCFDRNWFLLFFIVVRQSERNVEGPFLHDNGTIISPLLDLIYCLFVCIQHIQATRVSFYLMQPFNKPTSQQLFSRIIVLINPLKERVILSFLYFYSKCIATNMFHDCKAIIAFFLCS